MHLRYGTLIGQTASSPALSLAESRPTGWQEDGWCWRQNWNADRCHQEKRNSPEDNGQEAWPVDCCLHCPWAS